MAPQEHERRARSSENRANTKAQKRRAGLPAMLRRVCMFWRPVWLGCKYKLRISVSTPKLPGLHSRNFEQTLDEKLANVKSSFETQHSGLLDDVKLMLGLLMGQKLDKSEASLKGGLLEA